jgi:hypothetical protein
VEWRTETLERLTPATEEGRIMDLEMEEIKKDKGIPPQNLSWMYDGT